jgi:SAM-dependent methyltransferase
MTKKNWNNFFQGEKNLKKFGEYVFDYSKPDQDVINLVSFLKENKVKTILDLGCGAGRNSKYLSEKGFRVMGIDISEVAIRKAKKDGGEAKYFLADMRRLPFPNDSFETIISIQTIFHGRLSDIRKTIKEIFRVSKNGGIIFLTLQPIKGNKFRLGKKLETNTYISSAGDDKGEIHHFFDKKEILKEFCDFKIIDLHLVKENNYWYLLMKKK